MTSAGETKRRHRSRSRPSRRRDVNMLLIGVGNEFRSDDGLGLYVAREFRRRRPDGVQIVEQSGEGTGLMSSWHNMSHVFIIDAIVSGQPSGILYRFDANVGDIPRGILRSSSHTFGVREAIDLARELQQLPVSMFVYGIEGESFDHGVGLSEAVVRSVPELIHVIELDMKRLAGSISQI